MSENDEILAQVVGMGFDLAQARNALERTGAISAEPVVEYILSGGASVPDQPAPAQSSVPDGVLHLGAPAAAGTGSNVPELPNGATNTAATTTTTPNPASDESTDIVQEEIFRRLNPRAEKRRQVTKETDVTKQARAQYEAKLAEKRAKEQDRQRALARIEEDKRLRSERILGPDAKKEEMFAPANASAIKIKKLDGSTQQHRLGDDIDGKVSSSTQCKIQVRFPDGHAERFDLTSDDRIRVVHDHVCQAIASTTGRAQVPDFALVATFPTREYHGGSLETTLADANLAPRGQLSIRVLASAPGPTTTESMDTDQAANVSEGAEGEEGEEEEEEEEEEEYDEDYIPGHDDDDMWSDEGEEEQGSLEFPEDDPRYPFYEMGRHQQRREQAQQQQGHVLGGTRRPEPPSRPRPTQPSLQLGGANVLGGGASETALAVRGGMVLDRGRNSGRQGRGRAGTRTGTRQFVGGSGSVGGGGGVGGAGGDGPGGRGRGRGLFMPPAPGRGRGRGRGRGGATGAFTGAGQRLGDGDGDAQDPAP